jgi:hypothetical protein
VEFHLPRQPVKVAHDLQPQLGQTSQLLLVERAIVRRLRELPGESAHVERDRGKAAPHRDPMLVSIERGHYARVRVKLFDFKEACRLCSQLERSLHCLRSVSELVVQLAQLTRLHGGGCGWCARNHPSQEGCLRLDSRGYRAHCLAVCAKISGVQLPITTVITVTATRLDPSTRRCASVI